MIPRQILDESVTPDGNPLELALEHENYIVRVSGVPLMASGMSGSEEAMAPIAQDELGQLRRPRILIGGLGMGYTLRSVLDTFADDAEVVVAELMPKMLEYNQTHLAHLADHPLDDPRVEVRLGDVREQFEEEWDAILLDVDNGPDALTKASNSSLYSARGTSQLFRAVSPGGVAIIWSAYPSSRYLNQLNRTGFQARATTVRGRWPEKKGPKHTLFVALKND